MREDRRDGEGKRVGRASECTREGREGRERATRERERERRKM